MAGRGGARACWNRPFSLTTGRVWRPSGGARMHRKLVESALLVFAEKGVDASAIEDVIAAADVSRGTFYNYFRTNGELLAAAIQELGNELVEHIEERVASIPSPAARLFSGLRLYMDAATVSVVCEVRRADRRASDRPRKPGQRLHPGPHRRSGRARRIRLEVGGDRAVDPAGPEQHQAIGALGRLERQS